MGRVQLPSLGGVEPLLEIVGVPEVQVADLGALNAPDAEEMSRWNLEGFAVPRGDEDLVGFGHGFAGGGVDICVEGRKIRDGVADDGGGGLALGGVGRRGHGGHVAARRGGSASAGGAGGSRHARPAPLTRCCEPSAHRRVSTLWSSAPLGAALGASPRRLLVGSGAARRRRVNQF